MRIFTDLHFDFMSKRKFFYGLSSVIILAGIISFVVKGVDLGIDFTGGTEVVVRFPEEKPISEVRKAVLNSDLGSVEVKTFGSASDYLIRTQRKGEGARISEMINEALHKAFPDETIEVLQENRVEAKIGKEIRRDAVLAIFFALIGILLYIGFRFKFVFASGAVLALFHDVLVSLGIVSIFDGLIPGLNLEFNQAMVAAFLTIVGYSVNDTVVVFDRVRENLKIFKTTDFEQVLNKSLSATMSRTVLTSGTTLLAVLALLLFGGEPTRGFAFALFVGILAGTYSSIYVASSLVRDIVYSRDMKVKF
ncbi:MAG: protein translocase subunit SecF [Chlorobi bacterium]|nr:protein translocase subunit SecF [Chlorobiota bacterium]